MNLEQSVSLEVLRREQPKKPEKKKMTALQMARHIFKISAAAGHPYRNITPEQWARKWLVSPVFILAEVETDRVALIRTPRNINKVLTDLAASASHQEPVVVDLNKNKLSAKNGYVPSVVAVDGAHRCYGEYLRGRDLMFAWVGSKALEKIRPEPLFAAAEQVEIKKIEGGKIGTAAFLYAAHSSTAKPYPESAVRANSPIGSKFTQDGGVSTGSVRGGVEGHPKDCVCAECKEMNAGGAGGATGTGGAGAGSGAAGGMGGPGASLGNGSGPTPKLSGGRKKQIGLDASVPAARSSGHLDEPDPSDEEVPPNPSDTKQAVEPSDQLQYEEEPQHNPPGVKGWTSEVRGKNNPMSDSPGSGVGPRLQPDKGASNSELRRTVQAKGKKKCSGCPSLFASAKHVKKIVTDFKAAVASGYVPTMKSKTPPGCEDAVMGLKKSNVDNPWAVANWMHDNGRC